MLHVRRQLAHRGIKHSQDSDWVLNFKTFVAPTEKHPIPSNIEKINHLSVPDSDIQDSESELKV